MDTIIKRHKNQNKWEQCQGTMRFIFAWYLQTHKNKNIKVDLTKKRSIILLPIRRFVWLCGTQQNWILISYNWTSVDKYKLKANK